MKFVSYIYTLFYIVFVHYLKSFEVNLENKQREKLLNDMFGHHIKQPSPGQSNVMSANYL